MLTSTVVQPSLASTSQVVGPTGPPSAWDGFRSTVVGFGNTLLSRVIDDKFPEASNSDVDENRDTAVNAMDIATKINPLYIVGGFLLAGIVGAVVYKAVK
jgi:hypothetical protein